MSSVVKTAAFFKTLNLLSQRGGICYTNFVRRIFWTIAGLWLCGLFVAAAADDYPLTDGTTLAGDVISYNDNGIVFRLEGDKYTQRIPWTKFTQEALQKLSQNPKIKPLADPFIETASAEKQKKAEVTVHEVSRLDLPPERSLLVALFSSSVGLVALMLIYAANIFAGYEIAVVRAQPILLVMGVAVVLPILGPIIFLVLPSRVEAAGPVTARPEAAPHTFAVPGSAAAPVAAGIHIVEASWQKEGAAAGQSPGQVFQRGQFTFNRRFFETKLSGFFSLIRRESEKNLVLTIKTGRGAQVIERITRISANEMHVEIGAGTVKKEIIIPFADVVEVQIKPTGA